MQPLLSSFTALSLLAALPRIAQAESPPAISSQPANSASITLSPIHLAIGIVEVTGEFRVADQIGLAGTLGGGKLLDITVAEAGVQLAYYFTGDFDGGFHFAIESQFLTAVKESMGTTASGAGLTLGSMLGWKWVSRVGFSFVAQGGVQVLAVRAKASNSSASTNREDSTVSPLINLNAGWSF